MTLIDLKLKANTLLIDKRINLKQITYRLYKKKFHHQLLLTWKMFIGRGTLGIRKSRRGGLNVSDLKGGSKVSNLRRENLMYPV